MDKFILVVDPIASPAHLVCRFSENGYKVIALQTLSKLASWLSYKDIPFYKIIKSTGNIDNDVQAILSVTHQSLVAGFYGISFSVYYADKIFSLLFPEASNSTKTSFLRSNKYEMTKKLNTELTTKVRQLKLPFDEERNVLIFETIQFFRDNKNGIVIKPSEGSALSMGVCLPENESDIVAYYNINYKPLFRSSDFLLQERLRGNQLYINTASYKGIHIVAGAGIYEKVIKNKEVHCLFDEPIDITLERYQSLVEFIIQTLDLLGMENGLSHIEVVETENGYSLIEINPRIAGASGFLNIMTKNLTSVDQIDAYTSLIEKKDFKSKPDHHVHQRLVMIRRCSSEQHKFIKKINTYYDSLLFKEENESESETKETSIMGVILLKSVNKSLIVSDYNTLVSLGMILP